MDWVWHKCCSFLCWPHGLLRVIWGLWGPSKEPSFPLEAELFPGSPALPSLLLHSNCSSTNKSVLIHPATASSLERALISESITIQDSV